MSTMASNLPAALEGDQGQASSTTLVKDGYTIPLKEALTGTISSSSSTIMSTHDNDTMESDDGEYEAVHGKKRRKTCPNKAPALQDGANLQVGCTVLYTPTDNQKIDSLSKFRLTDFLNNAAPGMVTVVRVNKARNILAVDVKRPAFKAELLKVTKLCTVPVRAYLPREHSGSFGVLRHIDPDYTENDIKTQLQSSIGIVEVKRLGKTSPVVRVTFAGEQVPRHVKVGLVRTEVIPYRACPLQCYKCYKFGHIAAACTTKSQLCHRCGKSHDGMCEGAPYCVNCEGDHASNAANFPVKERETEIIRYKLEHNTTFREAKGAVRVKKQVSKKMTAKNTHSPKNTINNAPSLTAEEFPLLKTPEGASGKSVDVASTTNTRLLEHPFDIQLLQEPRMEHKQIKIPQYTAYATKQTGKHPWAVILVRNSVYHHQLDLTKYCSETADFAGVQHIDEFYHGWARTFTDGSVRAQRRTATAAAISEGHSRMEKLSFHASSTTAELAALRLGLAMTDGKQPGNLVLLTDSRAALRLLENPTGHLHSHERLRTRSAFTPAYLAKWKDHRDDACGHDNNENKRRNTHGVLLRDARSREQRR
ncbi:hypothetical protein HPB47_014200 [Ixodes persulcatus]|uniref:Uncharacterized protein n=1 Tax=Ixodes persulcatus TaxID=34615 RepID=A0AC60QWR9_IXOPE|nr:hypothetical protein HPB47_014200 [Ixodes persulcatus]